MFFLLVVLIQKRDQALRQLFSGFRDVARDFMPAVLNRQCLQIAPRQPFNERFLIVLGKYGVSCRTDNENFSGNVLQPRPAVKGGEPCVVGKEFPAFQSHLKRI